MDAEMNFKLHDLFGFRIMGENKRIVKHFSKDYSYFKTDMSVESELDVIVSDFTPSNDGCYIINHKYYVKKNYLFCKDAHKIVKWSFCIRDIENKPTVYFNGGLFSEIFLRDYIIEPIMGLKLAQKGYSVLHASGVALNNKGYVFPACKGVGKTSTMLNLIGNGGIYLSNEPIIISNDGMVHSFPSYIHFYHYNLSGTPGFSKTLGLQDKIELEVKHLVYLLSLKYGSFSLNISPKELGKEINDKYPLESLILLTKTNNNKIKILEDIDKSDLIERLIMVNKFELQYFSDCLMAYSYIYPESTVTSYWQSLKNNLTNALSKIPCHEIEIPFNYDLRTYDEIYNFIKRI